MRPYIFYSIFFMWYLLPANTTFAYTHADTLRGSNGIGRYWWDVQHYDLNIRLDTATKTIEGINKISFTVTHKPHDSMQIDLQEPMVLDFVDLGTEKLKFTKDGNVYWVKYSFSSWNQGKTETISIGYHGAPRIAKNPPWDGGFIWTKDSTGKPWIAVACQGLGASVWWPCKDIQSDEPDSGMDMTYKVPSGLICIGNGKLVEQNGLSYHYTQWHWQVKNPINNYDVSFYIGDYVHWQDTLDGEKGKLPLDFCVLRYNEAKARKQFEIVKPMLQCFENKMGPYPFYEDGYKLVEAPYLGMEHQSAVAYGNLYKMGYLGLDRSLSGQGLKFDFIIVHESGHEWFGNNITAKDIADNWIHEGITTYSETIFAECLLGKEAAYQYCRGEWHNIRNDKPIIGDYGVQNEGSGDMYDKGSAVIHMIRMMMDDDKKFFKILKGLNETFYHSTVTSADVENYISKHSKLDLQAFFNQYLRSTDIPELEYYVKDKQLFFHFNNIVPGFTLPLELSDGTKLREISPSSDWQHVSWKGGYNISFSKDFLIRIKE